MGRFAPTNFKKLAVGKARLVHCMSPLHGTSRTFRNVRFRAACADIRLREISAVFFHEVAGGGSSSNGCELRPRSHGFGNVDTSLNSRWSRSMTSVV
jgi:hypothetical protein